MNRADGIDCYQKALRQGQRDYREKMNAGQSPFLPVLDDILQNVPVENQIPLGQVEIPLELLVGTKTSGRTAAFASNFMPLLGLKTEFATKWVNLCVSHLDEGIRDPITCYEYMGRFYVQEGNKRVSVLKYFDASSITGNVTRVVPQYSDDPAVQMYYEFMHFYPVMQNYLLTFTKPGSYARLQKILGKAPDEKWTGEDRTEVLSLYNWVKKAFLAHGGARLQCTVGDVLLLLLRCRKGNETWAKLKPQRYAHRGYHDKPTIPENSMPAFRRAIEHGWGAELDVHLLRDGTLAVFHDSDLKRCANVEGQIEDLDLEGLRKLRLEGTDEQVPLFDDVLALFEGKQPLIIELKAERGNHAALAEATCRMLDRYRVHYCIESFDPRCLIWLKKNRPEIVRGQLSEQFLRHGETAGHGKATMWLLGNLFSNVAVRPDFIAYRFSDRDNLCLRWCRKFYHVQEVNWTIRTKEEMEAAEAQGNLVIFECFDPKG